MKTFCEYVEEIKQKQGIESNYGVAKQLLIDPRKIGLILEGKRNPPPIAAYRIADILELDPTEVRACLDYEVTKDEQAREYIKSVFFRRARDVA